jgi:hypothetical protein
MLVKTKSITLPMRQSPDVRGVEIDFGGAPDHGRWRAMAMTITLLSPTGQTRKIKWLRKWGPTFGKPAAEGSFFSKQREPYERVIKIRLEAWEEK